MGKTPLIIIISLLVLISIISVSLIIINTDKTQTIHRSTQSNIVMTDDEGQEIGELNVNIEADIEVSSDCGSIECFEEKFINCHPSTVTLRLTDAIIYHYEIIGSEGSFCRVKSKFLVNPNPAWIGKEMTCLYDNSKGFEIAVQDMSFCTGELYDLMS